MVEDLIRTGEELKSQIKPGGKTGQMISGIEFETWAANTIFFLESEFPKSSITEKAIEKNRNLNSGSHKNYEFLMGTLYAAKVMLEDRAKKDKEQAEIARQLNS